MPAAATNRPHPRFLRLRLVGVGAWVVFALAWWRVVTLDAMVSVDTLAVLAGCALIIVAVDMWWVGHNRNIYRRKGPRRGRPEVAGPYTRDSIGRPLDIHVSTSDAAEVTVSVGVDGTKLYRPAGQS